MRFISDLIVNENCVYEKERGLFIFDGTRKQKILVEGDYGEYDVSKRRHFVIVRTRLGHPCAYIETKPTDCALKEESDKENDDAIYDRFTIDVHGGPTYYGEAYWNKNDRRMYLGWDYAHYGDYTPMDPYDYGKEWTMIEIFSDIVEAYIGIEQQNMECKKGGAALQE